jgi:hypothetical protein
VWPRSLRSSRNSSIVSATFRVFFDCFEDQGPGEYVPGAGRYEWRRNEDPLVRAVRRPAPDFEAGLVLTLYGKVQKRFGYRPRSADWLTIADL